MTEWKTYKLRDIVQFNPTERIAKGTLAKKVSMDKLIPYCREVPGYNLEPYAGGMKFRNGDTIMARITPCLENGKTSLVSFLDNNEVGFGSTEYIVFRAIENVTDSTFLYYFVTNPTFRNIAIKSMVGSSGRQRVQQSVLEELEVSLPSLEEQRRIAGILGAIDDKIENNRRINTNLELQAQALFDEMFFSDNDWESTTLGMLTEEVKTKVKGMSAKVLSPISSGELVLSEDYFTKQVYSQDISKYIVVEPMSFAYNPARINIGSIGINSFDFVGCVSPVYVVFKTKSEYENYFRLFVKSDIFKEEVKSRAIGGVRQTLSYRDFAMITTKYPPIKSVRTFNVRYNKLLNIINNNNKENETLATLRDTLLPKLMNGEIKL